MKIHVKEYFNKAVAKKNERDKKKAKEKHIGGDIVKLSTIAIDDPMRKVEDSDDEDAMKISDDDDEEDVKVKRESNTPITPMDQTMNWDGLKRKRESDDDLKGMKTEDEEASPNKRPRSLTPPAPPPPPPPPVEDHPDELDMLEEGANFDEEQSQGVAHLSNGYHDAGIKLSPFEDQESTEDADQRRPPPLPPIRDLKNGENKAHLLAINAAPMSSVVEASTTPETLDADMYDEQDEDMSQLEMAQTQEFEMSTTV